MSRIVRPEEGLPLTPFQEESFADAAVAEDVPSLTEELVTPEERLRRAEEQAAAIVEEAHARSDEIRRAAEAKGRALGEAEGTAAGLQAYEAQTQTLRTVAEAVQAEHERLITELAMNVVDIALAILRRMLGDIAGEHPEAMRHVVTQALQALGERASVEVRVHPSMTDMVERERESLQHACGDACELTVVADDAVAPGGCLLDTPYMQLDATVERVMERLRADAAPEADMIDLPAAEPEA